LVLRVLKEVYPVVEHRGGAGEKGVDLVAVTRDSLDLEYRIGIQVKLHEGVENDPHSLHQIEQAKEAHRIDAGIVLTTATSLGEAFLKHHEELQERLGIDIKVITRDEFVRLLLAHLGAARDEAISAAAPEGSG
jgi:hypothetical protein